SHELDLLAVEPAIAGDQHRLSRLQKISLGAKHLAEHGELEGAGLIRALNEGEAVAFSGGALKAIDHRAGELDAARHAALEQRRQIGRARDTQPLQAALVG